METIVLKPIAEYTKAKDSALFALFFVSGKAQRSEAFCALIPTLVTYVTSGGNVAAVDCPDSRAAKSSKFFAALHGSKSARANKVRSLFELCRPHAGQRLAGDDLQCLMQESADLWVSLHAPKTKKAAGAEEPVGSEEPVAEASHENHGANLSTAILDDLLGICLDAACGDLSPSEAIKKVFHAVEHAQNSLLK